jgi:bifunctional DNA-binding transcriptional regulator/antitoxin component of YhaV-PrlF toxin-antitoxin module
MAHHKRLTTVDEKYRVSVGRDAVEESGIRRGERLVVIPFAGGIILEAEGPRKFTESLPGFAFDESRHEADAYVKRLVKSAHS